MSVIRFLFLLAVPTIALASAPAHLPVQARLLDSLGQAIEAPTDVTFSLYATAAATTPLYSETRSIDPLNGYFSVFVGEVSPLDWSTVTSSPTLHVGMTVDGAELLRQPVGTVPFAAYAERSEDANTLSGKTVADLLSDVGTEYPGIDDLYTNADAIAAMGVRADSNALNHDRYTDAEALAAAGPLSNSNPRNHIRYSDAEALAAAGPLSNSNPRNHARYTDSEALAAVTAEDRYLRDTTDTLTGSLTVTDTVTASNDVVATDDIVAGGLVQFSQGIRDTGAPTAVRLVRMQFWRSTGATANRINFVDATGVTRFLDIPDPTVAVSNDYLGYTPGSAGVDSRLYFNIDSSPSLACTLLSWDDDAIRTPLSFATDGGNSAAHQALWGNDHTGTAIVARPGVTGNPLAGAEGLGIMCF